VITPKEVSCGVCEQLSSLERAPDSDPDHREGGEFALTA
jgi:hypothetical protein